MSIGPASGLPGSVAGQQLAQSSGADVQRSQQESTNQQRRVASDAKAEAAAGIGAMDEDGQTTDERDADGRRLWEQTQQGGGSDQAQHGDKPAPVRQVRDPKGEKGGSLDISG